MLIETIIVALIVGIVIGGSLMNLKNLSLKHIELFLIAFLLQAGLNFLTGREYTWAIEYRGVVHIMSYFLLFAGLYINRNVQGMKIISLGVLLNFFVIAANHGLMPVRADFLPAELVQSLGRGMDGTHGLLTEGTKLKWLADWIYCPLPWSNQMISVGDIVIDIGAFYLIFMAIKDRGSRFKFTYINRRL